MHLNRGEILGVIGPNGAGKTTLFNMISGVYQPTTGQIFFNEGQIQGNKPHKIAKLGIGRTYQVCQPFKDLTVTENILMAFGHSFYDTFKCIEKFSNRKNTEKVRKLLTLVGIDKFADTEAKDLSLAFQRRMEIARAMALDPQIILLDESAAGLTMEESLELIDLIRKLKDEGKSIILIEHNMRVAMEVSERVYVLEHGQMLTCGLPEEIQVDKRVIDAYLGKE